MDDQTLAFADYRGNKQFITAGNLMTDDRVAMIVVDYPRQARLKILAHVETFESAEWIQRVTVPGHHLVVERVFVIHLNAFDWNCPQHIVCGFLFGAHASAEEVFLTQLNLLERLRPMRIAIASDHAGFELKENIRKLVSQLGHDVDDLGAYDAMPSDYPDFAALVGMRLMNGDCDRGILICGSGVGVCVAANKMPGVRAGMCHDTYSGHQGVEHDDMNVLVMGSRIVGSALAREITEAYLKATFIASEERFLRRLNKVKAIESKYMFGATA